MDVESVDLSVDDEWTVYTSDDEESSVVELSDYTDTDSDAGLTSFDGYGHDVKTVVPIWDGELRCPQFHKLSYRSSKQWWLCDLIPDNTEWPRSEYVNHSKKTQYGLKESEPWNCITQTNALGSRAETSSLASDDYDEIYANVPVYYCSQCDFDICLPCYERAKEGMERIKVVADALNTVEKVEWMQSKLMVVGEGRAGKTSTVRTLLGEEMVQGLASTVGADLRHAKVGENSSWGAMSAEEQKNQALKAAAEAVVQSGHGKEEEGSVVEGSVTAVTGKKEVKGEGESEKELKGKTEGKAERKAEGKRKDLRGKKNKKHEGGKVNAVKKTARKRSLADGEEAVEVAEIAGNFNLDLLNTKDKDAVKFTIWDFGGQRVFYSLHHLFLTQYGVYLVVFSATQYLNETEKSVEFLQFWLSSIRLHAKHAPVILIATHVDALGQPKKDINRMNKELKQLLSRYKQIEHNGNSYLFPLSNKTGDGIEKIRTQIVRASQRQEFLHVKVSIRWLRTLDTLTSNVAKSWVTLQSVQEIGKKNGITSAHEVGAMLKLFNELGVIVHFTSTTSLEQIVITNPQFVIDKIGKVIRDPSLHKLDIVDVRNAGLEVELKKLQADAIASLDLFQYFWGREFSSFFVDLMRRTLLMSDWPFGDSSDQQFLIPSLLPKRFIAVADGHKCVFEFPEGQLPEGCFSRIACLCLDYSSRQPGATAPEISRLSAVLSMGNCETLALSQKGDTIVVISSSEDHAGKESFIVDRMVQKVNDDVMGGGLKWRVMYLDAETDEMVGQEEAKKNCLAPWFSGDDAETGNTTPQQPRMNLEDFMGAL